MPNVKKILGLNLHGTPWATSVCCGVNFTFRIDEDDDDDDPLVLAVNIFNIYVIGRKT